VWIPSGTYQISDVLLLSQPGVVLRGEGPDKTILSFTQPLSKCLDFMSGGSVASWYGGLIWVEPNGPIRYANPEDPKESVEVVKPARMGDFTVEVDPGSVARLTPFIGKMVQMTWSGDKSFFMHIAGHPSMEKALEKPYDAFSSGTLRFHWANQIERIQGSTVTFKKPLRLDIQAPWKVVIGVDRGYLTGVGVEEFTMQFPMTPKAAHLRDPGWNGVMFRRTAHCWVKNVTVVNADNGMMFGAEAVNCSVDGFILKGRPNHHGTMTRGSSHDNMVQNFRIESQPHHGINTEASSGNVWRKGVMLHGTFDSHCDFSFDSVRTDITVNNTGNPGGAGGAGPFVGRRMVSWNVKVTNGKGEWIAQPAIFPNGAIVGIQGAELELKATGLWHMPDGLDKGCVVADIGSIPKPADLYEAQFALRPKTAVASASAASPAGPAPAAPGPTTDSDAAGSGIPDRAKLKPDSLAKFNALLRPRIAAAISAGRPPTFRFARLGREFRVTAVNGDQLTLGADGISMGSSLLQLTPAERSQIARAVQRPGVPDDAAVAAFYSILAGDPSLAAKLLEQAGASGAHVSAAFGE